MDYDQLKLEHQICFPIYASSRLITRLYQPLLDELGLTYPQYLVMLVLWEQDGRTVQEVGKQLILNTNTLTPLLQRMESMGLLVRQRAEHDERSKIIALTAKGKQLKTNAQSVPERLVESISDAEVDPATVVQLRNQLQDLVNILQQKLTESEEKK